MANINIQNRLNPAPATGKVRPLGIDLSAWVSSASFAAGVLLIGPTQIVTGGMKTAAVVFAYAAFLAVVSLIQRHMRLATTAKRFGTPKGLITDGIFELSRNPIYVAFLLPLASLALFSTAAMIIATVIYLVAMNFAVIPREEQELSHLFGKSFLDYTTRTRRWI